MGIYVNTSYLIYHIYFRSIAIPLDPQLQPLEHPSSIIIHNWSITSTHFLWSARIWSIGIKSWSIRCTKFFISARLWSIPITVWSIRCTHFFVICNNLINRVKSLIDHIYPVFLLCKNMIDRCKILIHQMYPAFMICKNMIDRYKGLIDQCFFTTYWSIVYFHRSIKSPQFSLYFWFTLKILEHYDRSQIFLIDQIHLILTDFSLGNNALH